MATSVYEQNGYKDRIHYLQSMSEDYCIAPAIVEALADLYGEEEDFDGLVSALDSHSEYGEMYYGDI